MESENETISIEQMYEKNIDIANHYDNIRNYEKTIEYSLKVVKEDPSDTVCVTKIVYWSSFYHDYDKLFELMDIIRDNRMQISKMKEIFYRENKISFKEYIVKRYIECIKKQEDSNLLKLSTGEHLELFHKLYTDWDIYTLYDEYIIQKSIL